MTGTDREFRPRSRPTPARLGLVLFAALTLACASEAEAERPPNAQPASRASSRPASRPASAPASRPASRPLPPPRPAAAVKTLAFSPAILRLPPGGVGAGALYLTIESKGPADTLLGASTPLGAHTMLHETVMDGETAKMVHADRWTLPAAGKLALERGGRHIMVMGLRAGAAPGKSTPVILHFAGAGRVEITAQTRGLID